MSNFTVIKIMWDSDRQIFKTYKPQNPHLEPIPLINCRVGYAEVLEELAVPANGAADQPAGRAHRLRRLLHHARQDQRHQHQPLHRTGNRQEEAVIVGSKHNYQ